MKNGTTRFSLLHMADLHIGKTLKGKDLSEDQRFILEQIAAQAGRLTPDAVLICGDIFDRIIPSESSLVLFGRFLAELRTVLPSASPIVVLPGNHDSSSRLAYAAELLKPVNIHIVDRIDTEPVAVLEKGGARLAIWALPFISHGAFEFFRQHSGRTASQGGDSEEAQRKRLCQQAYFDTIMEMIRPLRWRYSCNVLAAHCYVAGAQISETETSYIGGTEAVSAETFAGFDYVALGHLHRMQEIAPGIHYSGAPHAMDFSEGEQQKGVLHVELTVGNQADECNEPSNALKRFSSTDMATTAGPMSAEIDSQSGIADHPIRQVTQIALQPLHRLKRLRGSLDELLRRGDGLDQPDEDYIEAYLTDERQIHHAFDDLIKVYPNMMGLRWDVLERKFATFRSTEADSTDVSSNLAGETDREMTSRDRCIQHFRAFATYIQGAEPDEELMETFLALLDEEVQA